MTLGRPCPVVPLGAGERSSVGGAAAGGRSPPARCRALPGSGLVFRAGAFGPGPKNAAAPPAYREDCLGAAAFGRRGGGPQGRPLGLPNKKRGPEAKPPAPRFSGRFASSRRPPLRQSFLQRQKGKGKARPHDLWGLAHETLSGRGTATTPPLGQSRCPCPTGSGGFIRSAAGYYRKPPAAVVARLSPCAQHRRGRSTAVGVAPQGD